MQDLGSVQHLQFLSFVLGFPIGLSPRTMQGLGSIYPFSSMSLKLPSRRLSLATVTPRRGPWSVGRHIERAWTANLLGPQI